METQAYDTTEQAKQLAPEMRDLSLCSMCPWNRARIFIKCGHGLCERDAWRYSVRYSPFGIRSYLHRCPACHTIVKYLFWPRPVQAGYRSAVFDGGGARGMNSLVSFSEVIRPLDLGLQAHQYVDMIGGTSTGMYQLQDLPRRLFPSPLGTAFVAGR